jgi:hypothetical protein
VNGEASTMWNWERDECTSRLGLPNYFRSQRPQIQAANFTRLCAMSSAAMIPKSSLYQIANVRISWWLRFPKVAESAGNGMAAGGTAPIAAGTPWPTPLFPGPGSCCPNPGVTFWRGASRDGTATTPALLRAQMRILAKAAVFPAMAAGSPNSGMAQAGAPPSPPPPPAAAAPTLWVHRHVNIDDTSSIID